MGTPTQTQTQTTSIQGIGGKVLQMRDLLAGLASSGAGMLEGGSMQDLLSGNMSVTSQDREFIQQISSLTNQLQRDQAQTNFQDMSGAVEGQMLERGLEGSSIEAVNNAVLGRQLQQTLDQGSLQGQITSAQQLQQQAMNRTGVQLSANQLLLNQILSGAGAVGQMGLQERLAQPSSTGTIESSGGGWGQLGQVAGGVGGALLGGPFGAALGSQVFGAAAGGGGTPAVGGGASGYNTSGYSSSGTGAYGGQQSIPLT